MKNITREEIDQIFEDRESKWKGDNALQGLLIFQKYINSSDKCILQGARHDIIYGPDIDEMIEAGITKEDVEELAMLNWTIDDDSFSCFV